MQAVLEALPLEFRQLREAVHAFARLVLQSRLFPATHPAVGHALRAAHLQLAVLLERGKSVHLVFSGDALHCLNFKIDLRGKDDRAIILLRESLSRHAIGEIELLRGTAPEELACFARLLASLPCGVAGADIASLGAEVRAIRVRNRIEARSIAPDRALVPAGCGVAIYEAKAGDRAGSPGGTMGAVVRGILERLEKIRSNEGTNAGKTIMSVIEREGKGTATILLLNSLREFDDYTFTHSINVAVIAAAIARELGFPDGFIDGIAHAALMHDIGKLYVPREILRKSGRLTPSEWQAMKRHPVDGERILREEGFDLLCRRVAHEHHMRHDLAGYPNSREGFETHKASEIVRIADSYDALTTKRPYRRQLNPYEAIKLMARGSGTEFHQDYFNVFLRMLGNVPIGSVLKLSTGETALVVGFSSSGDEIARVRLLSDASGAPVAEEIVIDLGEIDPATGTALRRVAGILENPVRDIDVGQYCID
jgi:putative nucleotidyltransferase with HDIG domain